MSASGWLAAPVERRSLTARAHPVNTMPVRTTEQPGVCVVTVEGDLSGATAAEAQQAVDEVLLRGPGGFVFDLEECDFIDSAGLEMLCRLRRRCDEAGGRLELACVDATCRKILEFTRLSTRFDCHADLARALSAAR